MESDLPVPIDDSMTYQRPPSVHQEEQTGEVYGGRQEYYYQQPPLPPPPVYMMQPQKKDIFSELDRIHWVIFIATVLLAFFMGKSIATPIILRSS